MRVTEQMLAALKAARQQIEHGAYEGPLLKFQISEAIKAGEQALIRMRRKRRGKKRSKRPRTYQED